MSQICRTLVAAVTVFAVVIGGASCQSTGRSEQPEKTAAPESSKKSRATPSSELPDAPNLIEQRSKDGAVAFFKYYYDLVNYGRATGDWEPVQSVTNKSCKKCREFWADEPKRMNNDRPIRFLSEDGPTVSRFIRDEASVTDIVSSDQNAKNVLEGKSWIDNLAMKYRNGEWGATSLKTRNSLDSLKN